MQWWFTWRAVRALVFLACVLSAAVFLRSQQHIVGPSAAPRLTQHQAQAFANKVLEGHTVVFGPESNSTYPSLHADIARQQAPQRQALHGTVSATWNLFVTLVQSGTEDMQCLPTLHLCRPVGHPGAPLDPLESARLPPKSTAHWPVARPGAGLAYEGLSPALTDALAFHFGQKGFRTSVERNGLVVWL